ncbi:MAG: ORF6N domain-containing protein [Candidatus Susulua stagnicola]|nr:ORF6N domain-containing protein [Candidatus Susulua stagnicola]
MKKELVNSTEKQIRSKIHTIRKRQIMFDRDLAGLYRVEIKRLNEQVKRNIDRFPKEFMFQLTKQELNQWMSQIEASNDSLRSHFATLKDERGKHRKYLPYVFTEQGVAMLSAVLKSDTAIRISIQIMNAFVQMRRFIQTNAVLFQRLDNVEQKQLEHKLETNKKFEKVFKALEKENIQPKQGIFFDGQVFEAYLFVSKIIKKAKKSIILIDNYIDESVLTLLDKRKKGVSATIFTKQISKQLHLDLKKHNAQYHSIEIKIFNKSHDRFLIIDKQVVYHIGASLKDLGKKWFAFSQLDKGILSIMEKIK